MILTDLDRYNEIVIQIHNDPDADAVGSGFALYRYFTAKGKKVRLVYGGRNEISKSNMRLLVSELDIPVEYITELQPPELLLTVDCQYGEGNVQRFEAQNIAMIDHHNTGRSSDETAEIRSHLVSCATVCYSMLNDAGFDVNADTDIATALYYGLFMDSSQLSEISHPLDRDMIDFLQYDKALVNRLKFANFSISELETAGIAITHNNYIEKHRTAIVHSQPCDPNILGVIGDFVIQVDSIDVCVIYNECQGGYKLSVRSCAMEVAANEFAAFLTSDVGNGGGHLDKAGGFISASRLNELYSKEIETYLAEKIREYYEEFDVVRYTDDIPDMSQLIPYVKLPGVFGYVKSDELFPNGTELKIRTLEGDVFITASENIYIMIGISGEAYPMEKQVFNERYTPSDEPYSKQFEYPPSVIDTLNGVSVSLMPHAHSCISGSGAVILARPVEKYTKVFTKWNYEAYMTANKGDMLCYTDGNTRDVYVVKKDIFAQVYTKK